MPDPLNPLIIQGGMGVAVSGWQLARAVSLTGQMGVVSGTALDAVLARRLQLGDPGGHLRRALEQFPVPGIAKRILDRYFIAEGKPEDAPFVSCPMASAEPGREHLELLVASNFVEVYLAKENHSGLVGINYLEKVQLPTLPSLFGAMLAGVDYVLMGAGIPRAIPGIIDRLARGEPVELTLDVTDKQRDEAFVTRFDPAEFYPGEPLRLARPRFLAIVSSATLATMLARRASGRVDGFVVEGPAAGGHNAPPRGTMQLNDRGEPIYGDRDIPDLAAFRALELPFWLAGAWGTPERLVEALDAGAAGIQVGTAFAFCEESGLSDDLKREVLAQSRTGDTNVKTDPAVSPTGFPFKVLRLEGTMSDPEESAERLRTCDLGYLRRGYRKEDGTLGWRCPAEDVESYLQKGGDPADVVGRECVCNALLANIGLGQIRRDGACEKPLVTCGDAVSIVAALLPSEESLSYSAVDVVDYLLSQLAPDDRQPAVVATAGIVACGTKDS